MGNIERRQSRIRKIRQKFDNSSKIQEVSLPEKEPEKGPEKKPEKRPKSWASEYHIGKTQNHPLNLRVFTNERRYDPAAKVCQLIPSISRRVYIIEHRPGLQNFMHNLKEHLLPRIHAILKINVRNLGADHTRTAQNTVLFMDNRVYQHKVARFHYTTYDVRRAEDVINPRTTHCNIMLLSDLVSKDENSFDVTTTHPFRYGRVIGIYHANVVYTGPGMKNYEPMRFDFLHVRWFQLKVTQTEDRTSPWQCTGLLTT